MTRKTWHEYRFSSIHSFSMAIYGLFAIRASFEEKARFGKKYFRIPLALCSPTACASRTIFIQIPLPGCLSGGIRDKRSTKRVVRSFVPSQGGRPAFIWKGLGVEPWRSRGCITGNLFGPDATVGSPFVPGALLCPLFPSPRFELPPQFVETVEPGIGVKALVRAILGREPL